MSCFIRTVRALDHLWRMNSDGSNQVQLTDGYAERNAVISPDGRWVYYNTATDLKLWKVAIEGGEPIKLIDQYALCPSVSPDGKLVAYYQVSNGPRKHSITLGRVEDMKTVTQISLAPGSWISARSALGRRQHRCDLRPGEPGKS